MTIRERQEQLEYQILSPYASKSAESQGRDREEEPCDIRPVYQRDRDRILHSKAFRRMKHKTQVFLAPEGDHYRTRLTHTLEVSQIARTIARALRLNEDLTEAIALGHDLGHTPFGHCGEYALNEKMKEFGEHFEHREQSIRVVEILENGGRGLNLTREVRDGILNHSLSCRPSTPEGAIVRLSDKIAYLNHDIDDAISAGILHEEDLPEEDRAVLGRSVHERLNFLIHDIIENSGDGREIRQSEEAEKSMLHLRAYMFREVYLSDIVQREDAKVHEMLSVLFDHYMEHPAEMSEEFYGRIRCGEMPKHRAVCDYIACMTDSYAIAKYQELYIPVGWGFHGPV